MATIAEHLGMESAMEAVAREARERRDIDTSRFRRGLNEETSVDRALRRAGVKAPEVQHRRPVIPSPLEGAKRGRRG